MKKVAIIMGSDSDFPVVSKAVSKLKEFGVEYEVHVMSAHRTPDAAIKFSAEAKKNGFGVIIAAKRYGGTSRRCSCGKNNPPCDRNPM